MNDFLRVARDFLPTAQEPARRKLMNRTARAAPEDRCMRKACSKRSARLR